MGEYRGCGDGDEQDLSRPLIPNSSYCSRRRVQEWLPQEHLCYFISNIVNGLDLTDITARSQQDLPRLCSFFGQPYVPVNPIGTIAPAGMQSYTLGVWNTGVQTM